MKEEDVMKHLAEMVATVELTIQDWNVLINVLNMPQQAQVIVLAKLIDALQMQIGPQVVKARETLEAIEKVEKKDES